jgi:hypothetical protein
MAIILGLFFPEFRLLDILGILPSASVLIIVLFCILFIVNAIIANRVAERLGFGLAKHLQTVNKESAEA